MGLISVHANQERSIRRILERFHVAGKDIDIDIVLFDEDRNDRFPGTVTKEMQAHKGLVTAGILLMEVELLYQFRDNIRPGTCNKFLGRRILRIREDFIEGTLFNDTAAFNDRYMITDFFDDVHLVGDHDNRDMKPFIDVPQEFQNRFRRLGIKGACSFVTKKHLRIGSKGAGNTDALFLAARQLG